MEKRAPKITKAKKDGKYTCTVCGGVCWHMTVCSSCQVTAQLDNAQNWAFQFVTMWAKRLCANIVVRKRVKRAHVVCTDTRGLGGTWSVMVVVDGRLCKHRNWNMTRKQAERMVTKLQGEVELNGLWWA